MDEDAKAELDRNIRLIADHLKECPKVCITYFLADRKKAGGAYQVATGAIKKIDDFQQVVVMMDGAQIPINDIYEIESELLRPML